MPSATFLLLVSCDANATGDRITRFTRPLARYQRHFRGVHACMGIPRGFKTFSLCAACDNRPSCSEIFRYGLDMSCSSGFLLERGLWSPLERRGT